MANGTTTFVDVTAQGEGCYSLPGDWSAAGFFNRKNPFRGTVSLLFLQIVTFTVVTRLVRLLLRPLKQPAVISEIIAGLLFGPSCAGQWSAFTDFLFPAYSWFLAATSATLAMVFILFNEFLKQDVNGVIKSGSKEIVMSFSGWIVSYVSAVGMERILFHAKLEVERPQILKHLPVLIASSSFPVIQVILAEFDLLNSELGRLSMSLSMLNSVLSSCLALFSSGLRYSRPLVVLSAIASEIALLAIIFLVIRPLALWLIRKTPEGRQISTTTAFACLLVIMAVYIVSDLIGTINVGLVFLALAVPAGPPLASGVLSRTETGLSVMFMPLFYILNGLRINVFAGHNWRSFWMLQFIVWAGVVGKFGGIVLSSLYYNMSVLDSFALACIMCLKGWVEIAVLHGWVNLQLVDKTEYIAVEASLLSVTIILCPVIHILSRGTQRVKASHTWKSMEQSVLDAELRLLVCIHNEDDVPAVRRLLNSSHATKKCPLHLVVLRIVELLGRGLPVLVSHRKELRRKLSGPTRQVHHIFRGFQSLEKHGGGCFTLYPFTSISPYKTVKEDIYKLAFEKRAFMVIIPFHKPTSGSQGSTRDAAGRLIARSVLDDALCSVGILMDGGHRPMWTFSVQFSYHIGLVFLGGPDDREALAYAIKMAEKPGVRLTILRCVTAGSSDKEKDLDTTFLGHLKLKVLPAAEASVLYKEETVQDVAELVSVIRGMGNRFDLMMVGRRHSGYSDMELALSTWSECMELGVIGDFLASSDSAQSSASLLVVQQKGRSEGEVQFEWNI